MALSLRGRKKNLNQSDFLDYIAIAKLGLNQKVIAIVLHESASKQELWREMIGYSFLSEKMKMRYLKILDERGHRLGI